MFVTSKKMKILFALITALTTVSCSKKLKTTSNIPGSQKIQTTPIIFCGNGLEYTTTAFSFLKNELDVRNAVRTGRTCTRPVGINLQDVILLPAYHVCVNEVEYISAQNIVSYNNGFLYAPGLTATGHNCSLFQNGFEKP